MNVLKKVVNKGDTDILNETTYIYAKICMWYPSKIFATHNS